jgi:uncharacterized protein YukE
MTTPTVSVNTADIRRAASHVREAADELTKRLTEVSELLAPAGPGPAGWAPGSAGWAPGSAGWATIAAMGTCASTSTGQLRSLVDALNTNADELRDAAARYDDADRRSAHRQGGRFE